MEAELVANDLWFPANQRVAAASSRPTRRTAPTVSLTSYGPASGSPRNTRMPGRWATGRTSSTASGGRLGPPGATRAGRKAAGEHAGKMPESTPTTSREQLNSTPTAGPSQAGDGPDGRPEMVPSASPSRRIPRHPPRAVTGSMPCPVRITNQRRFFEPCPLIVGLASLPSAEIALAVTYLPSLFERIAWPASLRS